MRKYFRSVLTVAGLGLFFFFASSLKAQDQPDILNLQIPQFAITNATMGRGAEKVVGLGDSSRSGESAGFRRAARGQDLS